MSHTALRSFSIRIVAGFCIFVAAQAALVLASGGSRLTIDGEAWFLNSARGVVTLAGMVAAASAAMSARWSSRMPLLVSAVTLGASLAMTLMVFVIGPGTLFPIVIAVGTAILGTAVVAGSLLGRTLVMLGHRRGD
jgi:hypothetical protein